MADVLAKQGVDGTSALAASIVQFLLMLIITLLYLRFFMLLFLGCMMYGPFS